MQYGLAALNGEAITTTQFLDLNEKIGGYDQDAHYVADRSARERMREANGHAENFVMWRGSAVRQESAWQVLNDWVIAIKSDHSNIPERVKVIRNKPAEAVDGCWASATEFVPEPQTSSSQPDTQCNTLFPSYTFPALRGRWPLAANKHKCQLKTIEVNDYDVLFTTAELTRLSAIFPDGVCDWSKPGINQTGVVPWASFGPSPDNLVFAVTHPWRIVKGVRGGRLVRGI